MKICTKCKIEKHLSEFYARKDGACGFMSRCKVCEKQKVLTYQKTPNGKMIRQRYRQSDKGRLAKQRDDKKYYQTENGKRNIYNNVEKYKATPKGRITNQQVARRRRERKRMLDLRLTSQEVTLIYDRFGHSCFNCAVKQNLELDHHKPLSRGYGLSVNNAVLLCRSCNASKHSKKPENFYSQEQLQRLEQLLQS